MTGFIRYLALTFALVSGCVDVQGGALEARWDIRNKLGERIGCDKAAASVGLSKLRFKVAPLDGADDPCETDDRCLFLCEGAEGDVVLGSTPFMVPAASYAISTVVLDSGGTILTPSDGVISPSPVVRTVREGEVTDMDVNLIIADR